MDKYINEKVNIEYLRVVFEIYYLFKIELLKIIFLFKKRLLNKNYNSKIKNKHNKSILLFNPCLIGEFAASIYSIREFIIKNKNYNIDLVVSPNQVELAKAIKGIKNVFSIESIYKRKSNDSLEKNKTSKELNLENYNLIFVLRASDKVYNLIKSKKGIINIKTSFKYFISYSFHVSKSLLLKRYPLRERDLNFKILNVKNSNLRFDDIFEFDSNDINKVKRLLKKIRNSSNKNETSKIILIHMFKDWTMFRWSNKNWITLLNKLSEEFPNYRIVFIGSKYDIESFNKIKPKFKFDYFSLIGKVTLKELIIIMRNSDYFIGIDSGPANLAYLTELRSITILGPGPHMFLPYDPRDIYIDKSNKRGVYQHFFKSKKKYIEKTTPQEVLLSFKKLINN